MASLILREITFFFGTLNNLRVGSRAICGLTLTGYDVTEIKA